MTIPNPTQKFNSPDGAANDDQRHQLTQHLIKQFEHLYSLGARPVGEILMETVDPVTLAAALSRYDRLDAGSVAAVGGDTFPTQIWGIS
jgi:hypothetical protein